MPDPLPGSWQRAAIREIARNKGLYGSGASALPFEPDLPRYVRITDITHDGRLDPTTRASITHHNAADHLLAPGDLLFARSGATVGKTYLYRKADGICAHAGYVIRFPIESALAEPRYVFHWTQSPAFARWVLGTLRQGAQPNINATEYAGHRLNLPPLPEQRRIAEILDTVDEAIRKTEEIIAKLKRVKQGLLHDLLTRGIDDNGELRDPDRHPEQFKDSPLGRIPKGWVVETLGDLLDGIDGGWSPACIEQPPPTGQWGVLKVSAVSAGVFRASESKTLPANLTPRPELEVQRGDVVLTRANGVAALVGVTAQAGEIPPRLMLSDKLLRLTPGSRMSRDFLATLMASWIARGQIARLMSGSSGQKNISQAQIRSFLLPLPSTSEQAACVERLRSIAGRRSGDEASLAKLRLLKQGLMEDLLTGRVRVTALLEEAAE